jgi:hypothetical protein
MSRFDDAISDLKSALFAEYGDIWHHIPQKKSQDVNDLPEKDNSRPESNFCGIFFAPPSIQDINAMIGGSVNMPTVEARKNNITVFNKNDYIVSEKNDIYQISTIKESTRSTVILELKYIGNEL